MSGSSKLLAVGFVLVVGLGVALLKLTGGESATASTDRPRATQVTETKDSDPSRPADQPVTETKMVTAPGAGGGPATAPKLAPTAAALGANDEPIPRDERGLSIVAVNKVELAEANALVDPLVRKCIADAGYRGSGTAVLTLSIARKREADKGTSVEDTGVDDEGTTIKDDKLLECMHKTALQMKFDKPRTGAAIWSKRKIVIENGQLTGSQILDIGRYRGG